MPKQKKYTKKDLSFDFGYNVKGAKKPRKKTGPREWKGRTYGS